jgi:hypothetical protein
MEENYIQIFCTYVAQLLDTNQITTDDMRFMILEFVKVAEHVHSRQDLIKFLRGFPDHPEVLMLIEQLQDPSYVFMPMSIPDDESDDSPVVM